MRWEDYKGMTDLGRRIGRMVEAVKNDEKHIGVLSTGERLAVALILDRHDFLSRKIEGRAAERYTMLEAVDRLGPEWLDAAHLVQRAMDT